MSNLRRLLTALQATSTLQPDQAQAKLDTLVDLGYAQYRGVETQNGITQWLGMRFAAPPVGDLRFRAPADPVKEDGIVDASKVDFPGEAIDRDKIRLQYVEVPLTIKLKSVEDETGRFPLLVGVTLDRDAGRING